MRYSNEFKQEAINQYLSGQSISSISKETAIPQSTLYGWIKALSVIKSSLDRTPTIQEFYRLKSHTKKLESMLAVLQAAECTASAPLQIKLATIEQMAGQYSVSVLCDALKVAKGTYYNHILRNKRDQSQNALKREALRPIIREIFEDSDQLFGADKITAVLQERGRALCDKTVLGLMREMGLCCISVNAKREYAKWKRGENKTFYIKNSKSLTRTRLG